MCDKRLVRASLISGFVVFPEDVPLLVELELPAVTFPDELVLLAELAFAVVFVVELAFVVFPELVKFDDVALEVVLLLDLFVEEL